MKHRIWLPDNFDPPETVEADTFRLRILGPGDLAKDFDAYMSSIDPCLSGYHPHPLYVVCLLGLQARAGAGALRRRSG